jgi:hypothetical protein
VLEDVLDPGRAAAAGAALGQLACTLGDGGLLVSASRLVELNVRATILLVPGLFRLDLTPQEETLGVLTRPLTDHRVHWRADQSTWDGYRDAEGVAPLELHALWQFPEGPLAGWLHILSFTDRDAAAVHFIAKVELRVPSPA